MSGIVRKILADNEGQAVPTNEEIKEMSTSTAEVTDTSDDEGSEEE